MISTLKKKLNKKGFTLAELLIVVAIIAVLAAIAIPVFGGQLETAKHNADVANVRAVYAEQLSAAMVADTNVTGKAEVDMSKLSAVKLTSGTTVKCDQGEHKITITTGSKSTDYNVDADVTFKGATSNVYTYPAS